MFRDDRASLRSAAGYRSQVEPHSSVYCFGASRGPRPCQSRERPSVFHPAAARVRSLGRARRNNRVRRGSLPGLNQGWKEGKRCQIKTSTCSPHCSRSFSSWFGWDRPHETAIDEVSKGTPATAARPLYRVSLVVRRRVLILGEMRGNTRPLSRTVVYRKANRTVRSTAEFRTVLPAIATNCNERGRRRDSTIPR